MQPYVFGGEKKKKKSSNIGGKKGSMIQETVLHKSKINKLVKKKYTKADMRL